MTNKEAIEILSGRFLIPIDDGVDEFCERVNKALSLAIAALKNEAIGEWIPMIERLPSDGQACWTSNGEYVEEDCFSSGEWFYNRAEDEAQRVKYWMPMPEPQKPEPPKGEKNEIR